MRRLLAVAAVDLRRRSRSRVTLLVAVVAGLFGSMAAGDGAAVFYRVVPEASESISYAAAQTPAMVGLETGLTTTYALCIAGYFFFRGSLDHDYATGVDQLTATTPVSSVRILLGKWVAHVVVLTVLLCVAATTATLSHAGGELTAANPVAVFGGVLLLGLPAGAFVAGVTLLFESTDRLDGTTGSVVYFLGLLLFFALVLQDYRGSATVVPLAVGVRDVFGNVAVYQLTVESIKAVEPGYASGSPGFFTTLLGTPRDVVGTFRYEGGPLPQWVVVHRTGLVAAGALLSAVGAVPYDRWDPDAGDDTGLWTRLRELVSRGGDEVAPAPDPSSASEVSVTPVERRDADRLLRLVALELRRLLRGRRWWWYAGVVVLLGLTPIATSLPRQRYVGAALIWPVFVWASMGVESSHGPIRTVVHSSDRSSRQFTAEWLAGVLVAVIVAVPPIVAAGRSVGVLPAAGAVALFVPSAALASGLWTGSSRVFELGYLLLWYLGPLNLPELDYGGVTQQSLELSPPVAFVAAAPVVLLIAYLGRRRFVEYG